MLAYHNAPSIKSDILAQLAAHRAADELIKGRYWEDGKGCAVGCTIYSGNHMEYETRFGIPVVIARLEDRIFEGLPNDAAQQWPERLMSAIPVGADLSMVWPKFALWLLTEELPPFFANNVRATEALREVGALYREWCEGTKPEQTRWITAHRNASSTDTPASYTASYAIASDSFSSTIRVAADATPFTSYAITHAADAAASYTSSHTTDDAVSYYNARASAYGRMADKLIEIISA